MLRLATLAIEAEQLLRVLVQDLSFGHLVRGKPANRGDGLRTGASRPYADSIIAVAAVEDFLLMAIEEAARVVFVASQRIQARAGRHVGKHVRVIGEIPVRQTAGSYLALG